MKMTNIVMQVFRALREAAGEAWSAPVVDLQGSMLADALHARG